MCVNLQGSYTCQSRNESSLLGPSVTCPAGYKFNTAQQTCEGNVLMFLYPPCTLPFIFLACSNLFHASLISGTVVESVFGLVGTDACPPFSFPYSFLFAYSCCSQFLFMRGKSILAWVLNCLPVFLRVMSCPIVLLTG